MSTTDEQQIAGMRPAPVMPLLVVIKRIISSAKEHEEA